MKLVNYLDLLVSWNLAFYVSQGLHIRMLKMFGEKKPCENAQYILVSKLEPDFFVLLFFFLRFNSRPLELKIASIGYY